MLSMEEAWKQDQRRESALRDARQQILTFLENADGLSVHADRALRSAAEELWAEMQMIVRRWD